MTEADEPISPDAPTEPWGPPASWYRQLPTRGEHDAVWARLTAAQADGDTLIDAAPGLYVNDELWEAVVGPT